MGGKDLQRNVALQLGVVRAIHLAHSASPEGRDDLVWADVLTGSEVHCIDSDRSASSDMMVGRRKCVKRRRLGNDAKFGPPEEGAGRGTWFEFEPLRRTSTDCWPLGAPIPTLLFSRVPETLEFIVPVDDDLQVGRGLGFWSEHQESMAFRVDVISAFVVLHLAERVSAFEQLA